MKAPPGPTGERVPVNRVLLMFNEPYYWSSSNSTAVKLLTIPLILKSIDFVIIIEVNLCKPFPASL
jgi:hypothetical protein